MKRDRPVVCSSSLMMLETLAQRVLPPRVYETLLGWRARVAPKGSPRDRLAGAVLWSGLAVGISNVAGLAVGVVLAHMLGREGYGEVGVIVASCTLFMTLGGLGLGVTATKYSAQMRSRDPGRVGRFLGGLLVLGILSSLIVALLVAFFAPELARVLNRPGLVAALRLAAIVLLLQGIDSVQMSILAGFEAFAALARVMLLRPLVHLPATIVGAYVYGLEGVVGAMILSTLFTVLLHRGALRAVFARAGVSLTHVVDFALLRPLWEFALPAFLTTAVTLAATWGLSALLVNQPDGYLHMGLFNAANQWRALGTFIPSVFNPATFSIQSNLFATNRASYHRSVIGNLVVQSGVAAGVAIVLTLLSPYLMRMYGSQFQGAAEVLALLAWGWFLVAPSGAFWSAAVSRDQAWTNLLFLAIGTACQLVFAKAMVSEGARGIALAVLYGGLIQVGLQAIHYSVTRHRDRARDLATG
jgi:O-antigen/teichoic acid export membrane protein